MSKICDRSPPARAARLLAVVAGAVLLLGVAPLAYAVSDYGSVTIQYVELGTHDWISIKADVDRDDTTGDANGYDWVFNNELAAGQDIFLATDTAGLRNEAIQWFLTPEYMPADGYVFTAYCIDVNDEVTEESRTYYVKDLEEVVVGGSGNPGRTLGTVNAGYLREFFARNWSENPTKEEAEAFAAGLYEIIYDDPGVTSGIPTGYDLDSGFLVVDDLYLINGGTLAKRWLTELDGSPLVGEYQVFALVNDTYQDVSFAIGSGGRVTRVLLPEPLTMVGVLMGFAGIGGYVIRKRKRA